MPSHTPTTPTDLSPAQSTSGTTGPGGTQHPAKVGYVIKMYPRFSETFIVREIIGREARGEQVAIASLRSPRDPRFHGMISQVAAPITWIAQDKRGGTLWPGLARLRELGVALTDELMAVILDEDVYVAAQGVQVAIWALENELTHLHAHFASAAGRTARIAAAITGLPWTVTAHAKDIFHEEYEERRREQVLSHADTIVAVADSTAAYLRETYPEARIRRIYNGVEAQALAQLGAGVRAGRARPGTDGVPLISAVGRLVPKKGWDILLDAVALLRDRGITVRVELVGSGPQEQELREQTARLGLDDAVTFTGALPQHDVLTLVAASTLFATPCVVTAEGDRDGLPTVLLESMALGTPVVSTPVSGVAEAVQHEETGLLAEPGDPVSLANCIERLLDDPQLRERLVAGGRARISEEFDISIQATNLAALTEELAATPRRGARIEATGHRDTMLARSQEFASGAAG